jgi:hypothetical protein
MGTDYYTSVKDDGTHAGLLRFVDSRRIEYLSPDGWIPSAKGIEQLYEATRDKISPAEAKLIAESYGQSL